jgi:biotin carboxylase
VHPDRTLLLVGATGEIVRKAKELGLYVLVLQHPERITEAPCDEADLVRIVNYTDLDAVELAARELHKSAGFSAAVSLTEPGLEGAGRVNDLFELGGTGLEVARRMRDKWAMRRQLAGSAVATVGAAPLTKRADLGRFGARYGYPFIVKPVDGTGSYGVTRVDGPQAADQAWAAATAQRGRRMDRTSMPFAIGGFMMEEYADGPQFSVESFSFAGRHVVVSISETCLAAGNFAALSHAAPARLEKSAEASIRWTVCRFLDVMGLRDGPAFTEIRLGQRGPVVIEAHNRVSGGGSIQLVRGSYGIDLIAYAFGWPFRLVPELPDVPQASRGASAVFLVGSPGRVESVTGVERALAAPDVLAVELWVKPGDTVRSVQDCWDRLGFVVVSGADTGSAIRRGVEVLRDDIEIRLRGEDGAIRPARIGIAEQGTEITAAAPVATGLEVPV